MAKETPRDSAGRYKIGLGRKMAGEPGDRRFAVNGRDWRVRAVARPLPNGAPVNGQPNIIPGGYGVTISVALLDKKGAVAADQAGRLQVFDPITVTFQPEALQNDKVEPAKVILATVAERIEAAERQLLGRDKLSATLGDWGGEGEPAPAVPADIVAVPALPPPDA